jgi:hypothetical protein
MRTRNLPTIDAGYWAAIVAASICGTNTGDLAAGPLGMGHVRGILPLAAIFLAIVWAEKVLDWTTVAFYWLAIIVLRTMATNIADFATHDMKLSYAVFVLLLVAFMGLMIWADRFTTAQPAAGPAAGSSACLPTVDWSYWVVMLECSAPRWVTGWPMPAPGCTGRRSYACRSSSVPCGRPTGLD